MNQLLTDKHAVIYGGGGSIGAGVARTFAREGAHVHLVGRSAEPLRRLADELGRAADVAVLDAFDETAVQEHLKSLPRLDVSFNLVSRGDVQGRPLHELSVEEVMAPLQGMRSTLITARAAARRMLEQGAGVILWLTSGSAVGAAPGMGGTGPADAATDNYMRQLARENGRAPRLQEVADAAAFLASDLASGTTGTILNVTAGLVSEQ
jgi:NAD(P)-dependent dehydrogenase (short-subunit alcohol dehydrogenase family)